MQAEGRKKTADQGHGNAHSRQRNIQLRNIDLKIVPHPGQFGPPRKKPPETALAFRAADDITLENVRVEWHTKEPGWQKAPLSEDVTGLKIGGDCCLSDPGAT